MPCQQEAFLQNEKQSLGSCLSPAIFSLTEFCCFGLFATDLKLANP